MSTYGFTNLAWQLGGDEHLVREVAENSDALVLIECRDKGNEPVDIAEILGAGWRVWQDLSSPAAAGTALAIRRGGTVRARWTEGRRVSRLLRIATPGRKLQARYLRSIKIRDEHGPLILAGAHLPLESTGQQDEAMRVVVAWWHRRRGRRLLFADGNQPPAEFVARLGASGDGPPDDVVVAAWSHHWRGMGGRAHWRRRRLTDHYVGTYSTSRRNDQA